MNKLTFIFETTYSFCGYVVSTYIKNLTGCELTIGVNQRYDCYTDISLMNYKSNGGQENEWIKIYKD